MTDQPPPRDSNADDLLLDVVETLETRGLCRDQYQLQEHVDVDALDQLVFESDADVEIRVTVEGVTLSVSKDGIHALSVR